MKERFTVTLFSNLQILDRRISFLIIFSVLLWGSTSAQWTQVGPGINGEADNDYSGISLSIAADGSAVAIGAFGNDGGGLDRGHVRVYRNDCGMWTQDGDDMDGEADGDGSGWAVSISGDGSTVAIGAPNNAGGGTYRGHVRVYRNIGGTWTQLGNDLDGEGDTDFSGIAVSISGDGSIVAIGGYVNAGGGLYRGHVRVYKYLSGTWIQIGNDIDGEEDYETSGESVAISADGTTVAIGAIGNSGGGFLRGHVRVYKNMAGAWTQLGDDIDGDADLDFSGKSVSLSSDGTSLVVGSPFNSGGGYNGYVRILKYVSGAWVQQGARIDGEAEGDYSGISVSLSGDGMTVAIGGYNNAGGGSSRGHVRIYKKSGSSWIQQGTDIDGQEDYENSGFAVSLTADGNTVTTAGPYYSAVGAYRGQTRIFSSTGGGGDDNDCDGVGDVCDVCPGGDDMIDNDEDGMPDCAFLPLYSQIIPAWKCGNNKVLVAHQDNGGCSTLCVSYNAAQAHLNHGDYLGPCNSASCNNGYAIHHSAIPALQSNEFLADFEGLETPIPGFDIFPNPATDLVEIYFPPMEKKGELRLFNSNGIKIYSKEVVPGTERLQIETASFHNAPVNGLYFAVLVYGEEILVKTITILD